MSGCSDIACGTLRQVGVPLGVPPSPAEKIPLVRKAGKLADNFEHSNCVILRCFIWRTRARMEKGEVTVTMGFVSV